MQISKQLPQWFKDNFDFSPLVTARVWLAMIALLFVSCWLGYQLGDRHGLMLGFLFSVGINGLVIFYSHWRLPSLFPSQELEGQDPWGVIRIAQSLARETGIKCPNLMLLDTKTPTAFSAGLTPRKSTVYVSTGLVSRLSQDEIRAVLAYEFHRMKLDQTRSTTAAAGLAGTIEVTAGAMDKVILLPVHFLMRKTVFKPGPFAILFSPLIALLVRFGTSTKSVFEADRAAGDALGDRLKLAQALIKLDAYNKTLPLDVNFSDAPLFTVNPLANSPWYRLIAVQPSIEKRVKELTGKYPL